MEIQYLDSTGKFRRVEEMKKFTQVAARICYSDKDVEDLCGEKYNSELVDGRLLRSGHHSPFEHVHLTFYFKGIPKALAMVFNNERQYVTSEKSARYTQMKAADPVQKQLYDKWMDKLAPLIDRIYPQMPDKEARILAVKKLAQENARYMTSVFTPTKMVHTVNLRQLNFLINEFENYIANKASSQNEFERRLASNMQEFIEQTSEFKIPDLNNRTNRHLSLFNFKPSSRTFNDVYSIEYLLSFAGLAQAQRHRTITYNMRTPEMRAPAGFFIPEIIANNDELVKEWLQDLEKVAQTDFPQAQRLLVRERGNLEDFESKCMLRLCGHAQLEIMRNTLKTAERYAKCFGEVRNWLEPKCLRGFPCKEPCIWTGKQALERIV